MACLAVLSLAACAIGPNYKKPPVDTPDRFRGAPPVEEPAEAPAPAEPEEATGREGEEEEASTQVPLEVAKSMADLPWWEVFEDPVLQELLTTSLEQNYDLKIAVARTMQAQQQVTATRSAFFPQVGYSGSGRRSKYPIDLLGNSQQKFTAFLGVLSAAWEIDVWGRIRRANQSAKAQLLASEENQRAVLVSLVSEVASLYLQLVELDAELAIAEEAVRAFQGTLDLFTRKYEGGVASKLQVTRAAAAKAQADAWIPPIKIAREAVENRLSVLLGRPPGPIPRGKPLIEQTLPDIPPGLPSELLERRADVLAAEQEVVATNAEVGVAMGNFLPRIGLTAVWGGSSDKLADLANGSASVWSVAAEFSGPLFRAGMLYAEYKAAVARWEEAKARYELTALRSFAEVSDALVARDLLREQRVARAVESQQLQESVNLSLIRYKQGMASYFEVLQAQQDLFPALFQLAQTRLDELRTVIRLYKVLGGGWKLGTQWLPEPPESEGGEESDAEGGEENDAEGGEEETGEGAAPASEASAS